jgi:hypothetical protein
VKVEQWLPRALMRVATCLKALKRTASGFALNPVLGNPVLGNPVLGNPVLGNPVLGN